MAKKKNNKDNYNNDIVLSGDIITVSGNTNDKTANVELLNKPTTSTKKKDNKKYMAVVRLVKGNQLHTSQIFNNKESLKRWLKNLNILKSKIIEIDI